MEQLYCSPNLTAGIHGQLTFVSVLNAFLCIATFLWNTLILVALRKESSLHPPSKLLLSNLAVTLLLTVVISCAVSLWTLNAIRLNRLLALLLGLRYRQVITLKRVYFIIITFWIMSTVSASAGNQTVLEFSCLVVVSHHSLFTGFSSLDLLLYKDFLHPPSIPRSITRVYSTTEPNKSTEHRETQEVSVHCTVVAVHVSRLLSTICNFGNFDHSDRVIFNCFYRSQLYINFS